MAKTTTCRFCSLGITTVGGDRCLDMTCGLQITITKPNANGGCFAISSTAVHAGAAEAVESLVDHAVCQVANRQWKSAMDALTEEEQRNGATAEAVQIEDPWKADDESWMLSEEGTRELISVLASLGIEYSVN